MGGSSSLRVNRVTDSDDAIPTWKEVSDAIPKFSKDLNFSNDSILTYRLYIRSDNDVDSSGGNWVIFSVRNWDLSQIIAELAIPYTSTGSVYYRGQYTAGWVKI